MERKDFTTAIIVSNTPEEVFNAVTNVRGWWSEEIEGNTAKVNDVFRYHYKDVHACTVKLTEVAPGKRVVWEVLENNFSFVKDKNEWVGNKMIFEIKPKGGMTELRFTQEGLVPEYECYEVCNEAWTNYIGNSLYKLITAGKGEPNLKEGGYNTELAEKWQLENKEK